MMIKQSLQWGMLFSVLAVQAAHADPAKSVALVVRDAWVRGTVSGQQVTGAFMKLESAAGAVVTGATSVVAGKVELHESIREGEVMKMREVKRLAVAPGATLELKPGSYHIMLIDLRQPLAAGDSVPITLLVEQGGKVDEVAVRASVRAPGAMPHAGHH